jgi:hypothetical protein
MAARPTEGHGVIMAKTTAPQGPAGSGAAPAGTTTRAQPPIRWPHPDAIGVFLMLIWAVGVVFALAVPAFIVSPGDATAPTADVLWAMTSTIVGSLVMMVSAYVLYRRTHEVGFAVLGAVPAFSCLAGGIILAATKLTGTGLGGQ